MFADESTNIDFDKVLLQKRIAEGRNQIHTETKVDKFENASKLLKARQAKHMNRLAPLTGSHGRTTLREGFLDGAQINQNTSS
jgi:hypothetical protein